MSSQQICHQSSFLPMCQWWVQHHHPKCLWLAKASWVSGVMLPPSKQRVVCMWLASWAIKALKGKMVTEILHESSSSQLTQLDGTRRLCSAQDSCRVLLLSFCTRLWRKQHKHLGWSTQCLSEGNVSCLVTIFYFLHVTECNRDQMKQSSSGHCSAQAGLAGELLEGAGCWEVWAHQLTFSQLQWFGLTPLICLMQNKGVRV